MWLCHTRNYENMHDQGSLIFLPLCSFGSHSVVTTGFNISYYRDLHVLSEDTMNFVLHIV